MSDVTLGSWQPVQDGSPVLASPTELWPQIDESAADDGDYIESALTPSNDTAEVRLDSLTDPASSSGHVVRYRYFKNHGWGRVDLTVKLMEGAIERASWTHSDISATPTTAEQTLSAGEADSISDYSNLRLRFIANQP